MQAIGVDLGYGVTKVAGPDGRTAFASAWVPHTSGAEVWRMVDPPWLRFVHDECLLSPRVWVCGSALNNARLAWARKHHVTLPPAELVAHLTAARVAVALPGGMVAGVGLRDQWRQWQEVEREELSERLRDYVVALRSRAG